MRLVFSTALLLVAAALGAEGVKFDSPGSSESSSDLSNTNVIYPIGHNLNVTWEGTNSSEPVSVVLFQYDGKHLQDQYTYEYLAKSQTNLDYVYWTVYTARNLSFSNMFLLNLFYEGESDPVAVSATFNITDDSQNPTTATSTSSTTTASSPSETSTTTSSASSTVSPSNANSSGGLSTGAKIGLGVAIPVVVLLGVAAAYFLIKARAKKQPQHNSSPFIPEQAPIEQKPPSPSRRQVHELNG